MSSLKLYCFGSPRLERDGQAIEITLRKGLALFIYLCVTAHPHSRDALATIFWPENDQRGARGNLRRTLHRLNQSIGKDILEVTPETIGLHPQVEVWLDVEAYQQHIAACFDSDKQISIECLEHLSKAVTLYTDDFLAEFSLPDNPAFDEWQFFTAENLRQSFAKTLTQLISAYQAAQDFDSAIGYARRQLTLDPLHEPAHRQLMQLYAQSGQQSAAMRQYQECARLLETELGLAPDEQTSALFEAIKNKQPLTLFFQTPKVIENPADQKIDKQEKTGIGATQPTTPQELTFSRPKTQFVRNGEIHIAYQVIGQGEVDILMVSGFISHLELIWEEPRLVQFLQRLAAISRLIIFDKRGVGLSERVGYPPTLEDTMDDMLAVIDAAGCERVIPFGVSEGGPNSALFAATYPERVLALIMYGTSAKFTRSPNYPWMLSREQYDKWLANIVQGWGGPINIEQFGPSVAEDDQFRQWWAKLLRLASSPGSIKAVLEIIKDIDIRHVLPAIRVPTLILHRSGDKVVHVECGHYLAQHIPGANFVELSGDDHWWWIGDADHILKAIEAFLEDLQHPMPVERVLTTVLAIKLANNGSLSKQFHALVHDELVRFRGHEINRDDDNIIAIFDGPSRAIQCAGAIQGAAHRQKYDACLGLHTGECEVRDGVFSGVAIQVAQNILNRATPDKILVSSMVKDLVVGSGFVFEDEGQHIFEGITGEWRLFALDL